VRSGGCFHCHGQPVAFADDGYLRTRVAVLQAPLKLPDRFVAGHDADLSGRWIVHLTRLPVRRAVQPVPVRE
jgi:hypothetical protein